MSLLSADQLTQIRAQASETLDRSCSLTTVTLGASDAAGGFSDPVTASQTVSCRIAPPSGRDRVIVDRLGLDIDAVITLPYGTTAAITSRITDSVTSDVYEVVHANPGQSWRTATRVYGKRIA